VPATLPVIDEIDTPGGVSLDREDFVSLDLPFVETYRLDGLSALGDPTRRLIFETLAAGPCSVGELAGRLPVSRPAVSQHLRTLKDAGLVTDRAAGTRRIYQVDPAGVARLRRYLDNIWSDALAAFAVDVSAAAGQPAADPTVPSSTSHPEHP
jgi:DNA-binding transcriptional ArsR family regulator